MDIHEVIWIDPERMGGQPCFRGTRVPVQTLTDYLSSGDSLDEFLMQFPSVARELAIAYLQLAQQSAVERAA